MDLYTAFSLALLLIAVVAYGNHHTLRLPNTIAVMMAGCILAIMLIVLGKLHVVSINDAVTQQIRQLNFHGLLVNGILSFLLFAGALSIDSKQLRDHQWEVGTLALFSTISSCLMVGGVFYFLVQWCGLKMTFLECLLFGALISPTDPIAVLATFKRLNAPKNIHAIVAGESLFNDGVGVVLFVTIYHLVFSGHVAWHDTLMLFLQQSGGGLAYGTLLGWLACYFLRHTKDHHVQLLITLAVVTSGYLLAFTMGISGPLAMVVAGLMIGNQAHSLMSDHENLLFFWETMDELLNAFLFFLIGAELLMIDLSSKQLGLALLSIPVLLIIRLLTVAAPMQYFKTKRHYCAFMNTVLSVGGLRGGLAVALAVAIPASPASHIIVTMTFAIVAFSIIGQGLMTPYLVRLSRSQSPALDSAK